MAERNGVRLRGASNVLEAVEEIERTVASGDLSRKWMRFEWDSKVSANGGIAPWTASS